MNFKHGAAINVHPMYWFTYYSSYIFSWNLARPPWGREGLLFPSIHICRIYFWIRLSVYRKDMIHHFQTPGNV